MCRFATRRPTNALVGTPAAGPSVSYASSQRNHVALLTAQRAAAGTRHPIAKRTCTTRHPTLVDRQNTNSCPSTTIAITNTAMIAPTIVSERAESFATPKPTRNGNAASSNVTIHQNAT